MTDDSPWDEHLDTLVAAGFHCFSEFEGMRREPAYAARHDQVETIWRRALLAIDDMVTS